MNPDVPATITDDESHGVRPWPLFVVAATSGVIGASLTLVWLATRAVMSTGVLATSGGALQLTSASPGWIVALPVAIIALVVAMQSSRGLADKYDTPSLMVLTWSALFLALSWNFLEFGIRGSGSAGVATGLLIPGVAFVVMGLGGLYVFFVARKTWTEMDAKKAAETGAPGVRPGYRAYQAVTALCLVGGVLVGWWLFALLAG